MRNISFALTTSQFLDGSKTVTRRMGWLNAQAGDMLCAVKKGMGLKKGEQIERLGWIQLVSVRREKLRDMIDRDGGYGFDECRREGFPHYSPPMFVEFFCQSHKGCIPGSIVTRLEFVRLSTTALPSPDRQGGDAL
jgi:hypothetical protein